MENTQSKILNELRTDEAFMKTLYDKYMDSDQTLKEVANELRALSKKPISASTIGNDFKKFGWKLKEKRGLNKIKVETSESEVLKSEDYTVFTMPELFAMNIKDLEKLALIESIRTSQVKRVSIGSKIQGIDSKSQYIGYAKELLKEDFDPGLLQPRSDIIKNLENRLRNSEAIIENLRKEYKILQQSKYEIAVKEIVQ